MTQNITAALAQVGDALSIAKALTKRYQYISEGKLDAISIAELREVHYQCLEAIAQLKALMAGGGA